MSNLSKNLSSLLRERGWTQAQFADRAGVEAATVSRVMRGSTTLVSESLSRMAKALNVDVADLLRAEEVTTVVHIGTKKLPVWNYTEAIPFVYSSPNSGKILPRFAENQRYVLTDKEYSAGAFALEVTDGAMSPDLSPGMVAIIDPTIRPRPNCIVAVAFVDDGKPFISLRVFHDEGLEAGQKRFSAVPRHPAFPTLRSSDPSVVVRGVLVERRSYEEV